MFKLQNTVYLIRCMGKCIQDDSLVLIHEEQYGFRRGRECVDQVLVLKVEKKLKG